MPERDQTTETIIDALIGDFIDDPQRAHQIAELGLEKDSLQARVIDRLTDMLSWNLVEDAADAGFVLFEQPRGVWRDKATGRRRAHDAIPRGSVLLVPRRAEERLEAERAEARAAARASRTATRKGPKRHSASERRAITLKAQATREANRAKKKERARG